MAHTIYINTEPQEMENSKTGEKFFSSLVGVSSGIRAQLPEVDVLNWTIQPGEQVNIPARMGELCGYTKENNPVNAKGEITLPKQECFSALFRFASAYGRKLVIQCESVQWGAVREYVNQKTNLPQKALTVYPVMPAGEQYQINMIRAQSKGAVHPEMLAVMEKAAETAAAPTVVQADGNEPF